MTSSGLFSKKNIYSTSALKMPVKTAEHSNAASFMAFDYSLNKGSYRCAALICGLALLSLAGCINTPASVDPVSNFNSQAYLGTWYEVARLDHRFEKGMSKVSAHYSQLPDGSLMVRNCGYKAATQRCVKGKARFVDDPNKGFLKVSFFGPFYGAYVVFDTDYRNYSYVSGPNYEYLWLLSRTPTVTPQQLQRFIDMAEQKGFDTKKLLYPQPATP